MAKQDLSIDLNRMLTGAKYWVHVELSKLEQKFAGRGPRVFLLTQQSHMDVTNKNLTWSELISSDIP